MPNQSPSFSSTVSVPTLEDAASSNPSLASSSYSVPELSIDYNE